MKKRTIYLILSILYACGSIVSMGAWLPCLFSLSLAIIFFALYRRELDIEKKEKEYEKEYEQERKKTKK